MDLDHFAEIHLAALCARDVPRILANIHKQFAMNSSLAELVIALLVRPSFTHSFGHSLPARIYLPLDQLAYYVRIRLEPLISADLLLAMKVSIGGTKKPRDLPDTPEMGSPRVLEIRVPTLEVFADRNTAS